MGRLGVLASLGLVGLVLALPSGAAVEALLSVTPRSPRALQPARIALETRGVAPASRLRVKALSPSGHVLPVRTSSVRTYLRKGVFRFPIPGRWQLRVTDATGRRVSAVEPRWVRVRAGLPTPAPEGFGPLGRAGCSPASPANRAVEGFRDVFGTAVGRELWALPFLPEGASWSTPDAAVFDGLVGKEVKIVFAMTSWQPGFEAIGPDGSIAAPVWGPQGHLSSNWGRPGIEWGAGFVFPEPGCWRIRAGAVSDLWFLLNS